MTQQQIELLGIDITPINDRTKLVIESGLEWVKANTTLDFDMNNDEDLKALPSMVKLFLVKFYDVQNMATGVTSESISGLSQSFDTSDKSAMIWQFANELLNPYLRCGIQFVSAESRFV